LKVMGGGVIYSFAIESKRKDVLYWRHCVSLVPLD
jgi:hypothetical protein